MTTDNDAMFSDWEIEEIGTSELLGHVSPGFYWVHPDPRPVDIGTGTVPDSPLPMWEPWSGSDRDWGYNVPAHVEAWWAALHPDEGRHDDL